MSSKEIVRQFLNLICIDSDGKLVRLVGFPFAPPSPDGDQQFNVLSKDVAISTNSKISARLYLPDRNTKLPTLTYFHGGKFCLESAFSSLTLLRQPPHRRGQH
ncbi:hypothetical protein ACJRO7_032128 [Eucalyptus globulus]|uniref:Alpha/beta hydrolase fold-3 domain-containing protein n=1 Tax=Eucalyptus globulus TaxID=34317 RepID=A0ABD3JMB0_EUCGL